MFFPKLHLPWIKWSQKHSIEKQKNKTENRAKKRNAKSPSFQSSLGFLLYVSPISLFQFIVFKCPIIQRTSSTVSFLSNITISIHCIQKFRYLLEISLQISEEVWIPRKAQRLCRTCKSLSQKRGHFTDPYNLDIVRTVFHESLSIGELKFMAAIPSGKYIIYVDSGIAIGVISILDGPLCGNGLLSVSCYRGGAGLVYKVVGSDDTFKFELSSEIPAIPTVCNPLNANISIIFRQMNKFILRIEFLCPWKVGPTIEWKMLGEELRSGLHGIRAFPMVSVNGLVNMHGWKLVMQLNIFSVTIQKLKDKASFRNLDEFYYKMIKSKTVGGVHKSE
ncbi:hypothetical protein IFM89_005189 [Coptis chinensis]|uniref:Uncharacterized protein n=1 Tax=Coptis chinensis TaxID=261450 RepID=A0A835HZR0_9MAGN|nr:hypothetical protein IFM89_005189 [Coptis chinensis]